MSHRIDITKLHNLQNKSGKITAQCPACAMEGGDSQGLHLVIYEGGAFSCVKYPNDKKHNAQILKLAGMNCDRVAPFTIRSAANEPLQTLISADKIKAHLNDYAGTGGTAGTPESG